jgi:hypothetical protein
LLELDKIEKWRKSKKWLKLDKTDKKTPRKRAIDK